MDKFSLLLSVVAVGLASLVLLQERGADTAAGPDTRDDAVLMDRLARIEATLATLAAPRGEMLEGTDSAREPGLTGSSLGAGARDAPEWAARIEKQLAETNERLAKVETSSRDASSVSGMPEGHFFGRGGAPRRFFHNSEAAAKALELDERQKQDLERVVENTKDRLKQLYETPNEDGKTLAEISTLDLGSFDGSAGEAPDLDMGKLMGHVQKVEKFKKGTVPGTRESYRDAENRIRREGKAEARGLLNEDQAKKWDESHTDPLFSSPGSGPAVITSTSISSGPITIPGGK
jgi:hypothetical protein